MCPIIILAYAEYMNVELCPYHRVTFCVWSHFVYGITNNIHQASACNCSLYGMVEMCSVQTLTLANFASVSTIILKSISWNIGELLSLISNHIGGSY